MARELKVTPIRNGTVIDHLPAGSALSVCQVLGIPREGSVSTVSVVMNVPSASKDRKDIVKVEDRELHPADLERLAVLAPKATVNLIRDYHVAEKIHPELPTQVTGLVACPNPACISNDGEPVDPEFRVLAQDNGTEPGLECAFCLTRVAEPLALVRKQNR